MGGDHKCPVCQATFTRPQHVARHMRSHTGDRPYRCQYCGDQFARSDLLSRHVNKCHSNEKPLVNTGSRRKGSSSASRATTSKQACDQCVQSSLPCDGCNPCGKCVHRKCRCTFVKFHRQTAPAGPGHNPRPTGIPAASSSGSSSREPVYHHSEDFVLGPAPATSGPPASIAPDAMYSQSYAFPSHYANPTASSEDFASKYRAQQTELLRVPGAGNSNGPSFYASDPPPSWTAWGQQQQFQGPDSIHDKELEAELANHLISTQNPNERHHQQLGMMPGYPVSYQQLVARDRRGSIDIASGSDGGSSGGVSSSAASSSVHLPGEQQSQIPFNMSSINEPQRSDFHAAFGLMSLDDPNVLAGISTDSAPFFSSAMMGGQQFPDSDGTPMPMKLGGDQSQSTSSGRGNGAVPTPSREADTRELREFWKAYMRTPLTGPGSDAEGGSVIPAHTPINYRRPRVNSLPNNKTPVVEKDRFHGHHHHPGSQQQQQGSSNHESSLRTTLRHPQTHAAAAEDLRSYEAAVMARKAPTTLNLQPRSLNRRGVMGGSAGSSPVTGYGRFSGVAHGEGGGGMTLPPSGTRLSGAFGRAHPQQHQQRNVYYDASSNSPSPASQPSPSVDGGVTESGGSSDGHGGRPSFKRVASHTLESDTAKVQRTYPGVGGGGKEGEASSVYNPDTSSSNTWHETGSSNSGWREPSPNWREPSSSSKPSMDRNKPTTISVTDVNQKSGVPISLMMSHPDRVVAANLAERRRMRRMSAPAPRGDGFGGGGGGGVDLGVGY